MNARMDALRARLGGFAFGGDYNPTAYTPSAAAAFRVWLQHRYRDLEALNDAWYTRFWGRRYTSWEQVGPPEVSRSWSNPTRRLDFKRFVSDALLECFVRFTDGGEVTGDWWQDSLHPETARVLASYTSANTSPPNVGPWRLILIPKPMKTRPAIHRARCA